MGTNTLLKLLWVDFSCCLYSLVQQSLRSTPHKERPVIEEICRFSLATQTFHQIWSSILVYKSKTNIPIRKMSFSRCGCCAWTRSDTKKKAKSLFSSLKTPDCWNYLVFTHLHFWNYNLHWKFLIYNHDKWILIMNTARHE